MRRLSERAANSCANAKKPKCKCRCGGALHGKGNHGRSTEEIIGQIEEGPVPNEKAAQALRRLRETLDPVQESVLAGTGF